MAGANEIPGLSRIRNRFLSTLVEREAEIEQARAKLRDANHAPLPALLSAESILHKIAGSAGTLGLAELGAAARHCEEVIIDYREQGKGSVRDMANLLDQFLELSRGARSDAQGA